MDTFSSKIVSQQEFLSHRRRVFPHLASDAGYRWDFLRTFAGHAPDVFVLLDPSGAVAAGSAVTYRNLAGASGGTLRIGIMTGSWTLPEFRRQGWFTRMIQHSSLLARRHDCAALTAFVTAENASARRLLAAGSLPFPSRYIFSDPAARGPAFRLPEILPPTPALLRQAHDSHRRDPQEKDAPGTFRFDYGEGDFREQFFERPDGVFILRFDENLILAEESHDAIKILLLPKGDPSGTLRLLRQAGAWAATEKNKKLYYFTTTPGEISLLDSQGDFHAVPGWFTYLPLQAPYPAPPGAIEIQLGDKM
ncbi:MAG: hypothetical protein LBG65_07510 [Puniceicoccales bacterium]|jgi:hypothetical protein|nr:hypothetical protein [Puniceicoccales bacterium]